MLRKISKGIKDPFFAILILLEKTGFLKLLTFFSRNTHNVNSDDIEQIKDYAIKNRTSISDHLQALYAETLEVRPNLIVELGVRGGNSTYVFEKIVNKLNAKLLSIDIQDRLSDSYSFKGWYFERADDVEFANRFPSWCLEKNIKPIIDILFIDTSHLYKHTVNEIKAWFPYLSEKAKVFFHDTNMKKLYRRRDKSFGIGWNNQRGVIRAIEEYVGKSLNEKTCFTDLSNGWLIRHYANCNGFTILKKT
jgi:cephalosporin hydroxylase